MSELAVMLGVMSNPYYDPAELGLEIVFVAEASMASYSFTIFAVWRDADDPNVMFYATDSGCSCPSPFEDFHERNDLIPVTSAQQLHDALNDVAMHPTWGYGADGKWGPTGEKELASDWTHEDVVEGHRKISELRIGMIQEAA